MSPKLVVRNDISAALILFDREAVQPYLIYKMTSNDTRNQIASCLCHQLTTTYGDNNNSRTYNFIYHFTYNISYGSSSKLCSTRTDVPHIGHVDLNLWRPVTNHPHVKDAATASTGELNDNLFP